MSDLDRALSREVSVVSPANPEAASLHQTRSVLATSEAASAVFCQARTEGWTPDRLASALLTVPAPVEPGEEPTPLLRPEASEALRYLADEYLQIGDGLLVVSTETGRAVARLREEDIWQPLPVPREDGQLATPLPRIRPEIESYLVHSHHEAAREQAVLARRGPLSGTQAAGLTRAGRAGIIAQLQQDAPGWWRWLQGPAGALVAEVSGDTPPAERRTVSAPVTIRRGLQDMLAVNVHVGQRLALGTVLGLLTWRHLMGQVGEMLTGPALPADHGQHVLLWIAPARYLHVINAPFLVADVPRPIAVLSGRGPALWVQQESWEVKGRELFDRWEIRAMPTVTLSINRERLRIVDLPEPEDDPQVELVR